MSKENILFVCRQNVGRSQMGEGFLKALTNQDPDIHVGSAGIDITGMEEKYHQHPHPQVISVMEEIGIDISKQQITQVSPELLKDSTRVIVLTKEEELPDYFREFKHKTVIYPIEDPAPGRSDGVDLERLRNVRDQIKQLVSQFIIK